MFIQILSILQDLSAFLLYLGLGEHLNYIFEYWVRR